MGCGSSRGIETHSDVQSHAPRRETGQTQRARANLTYRAGADQRSATRPHTPHEDVRIEIPRGAASHIPITLRGQHASLEMGGRSNLTPDQRSTAQLGIAQSDFLGTSGASHFSDRGQHPSDGGQQDSTDVNQDFLYTGGGPRYYSGSGR